MKSQAEIDALRIDAAELINKGALTRTLREGAARRRDALMVVLEDLANRHALLQGVTVDDIGLSDALPSDDDKALFRQYSRAILDAEERPPATEHETLEQVIARLAAERGWNGSDSARAQQGDADVSMDALRDGAERARAKRARSAHRRSRQQLIKSIDQLLANLDGGSALLGASAMLPAALLSCQSLDDLENFDVEKARAVLNGVRTVFAAELGQVAEDK